MWTKTTEKRELCRFDMFTRRKKASAGPVKQAKEVFTYRGDRYGSDMDKMLKYLIGMVRNYNRQFAVMDIRDNSKPKDHPEHTILEMRNGRPVKNLLITRYAELINFPLPEWLSYEIDPNKFEAANN